ncbi:hypothetical protein NDA14_000050 [Ustilago hordei]|nr:hypothetical protein NDA14_000050 [Ustilago hordei]
MHIACACNIGSTRLLTTARTPSTRPWSITSSNITPHYVTRVQGGSLLPLLDHPDHPEVSPYQRMPSTTSFLESSPPSSIALNMPVANMLQPGSAHTATSATIANDSNAPAWVRMLLEQQAHAHCTMEERQANMLEQQASTFHLLETFILNQGPQAQHCYGRVSPHHPDYEHNDCAHTHGDQNHTHDICTSAVPQLLLKDHSLKPEEIAIFNPGTGDDVEVFCQCIQDIVAFKSQAAICKVLPQCLHSTAMDWYTNLSDIECAQLCVSSDTWQCLLCDHFGKSITEAHSTLSSLCYNLASDYHTYHKCKIRLACIASITIPKQIVQSLFAGLPFDMRNALASSLEGKNAGDLNIFCHCCLAQHAMLLMCHTEQCHAPPPTFKAPQHSQLQQQVASCPSFQPLPLADRSVKWPPPHLCHHCNGSHWDADCMKVGKPFIRFNPLVAAHHMDLTRYDDSDYAVLKYCYLEDSQKIPLADSDVDDMPGMSYSLEPSRDDSFGSN